MLKDTKKEKQEELLNKEVSFFIINSKEVFQEVFIKKFEEVWRSFKNSKEVLIFFKKFLNFLEKFREV